MTKMVFHVRLKAVFHHGDLYSSICDADEIHVSQNHWSSARKNNNVQNGSNVSFMTVVCCLDVEWTVQI